MNAFMSLIRSLLPRMLLAAASACAVGNVSADNALERVKQQGRLVAGVAYVVPEYKAGAKFRTPERLDTALAEEVARRMGVPLRTLSATAADRARLLAAGKADLLVAASADGDPLRRSAALIPTGYSAGPMAIMRSDTDIKTWEQLKGRTVCVAEDGRHVGTISAKYGAVEKVFKAPADSLLALRIGGCDAAVHDSALLEELIKFPEWKKFSARLPVGPRTPVVFAVPAGDANAKAFLNQVAAEWRASAYLAQLVRKTVRHIAFEVYLDQDVPDCH
jgi:polar amino acid transport system substrate-binding protein